MTYDDDRSLVRRLVAGDATAFDQFFDSHAAGLYRFALARMRGNADAAEDVVQATLSAAIRKLATYRGEAALFTWLCTFCRHEISAHYRRTGRFAPEVPLLEDAPEIRAALEALGAAGERPDERLRQTEVARLVRLTLDYLPERYGDALEWKYLEEISVEEIAARLEVSPKAAESVLSRARDAFRDAFPIVQLALERRDV